MNFTGNIFLIIASNCVSAAVTWKALPILLGQFHDYHGFKIILKLYMLKGKVLYNQILTTSRTLCSLKCTIPSLFYRGMVPFSV